MKTRNKYGSQTLDRSVIRRMIMENIPVSTVFGVVRKFPGEDSHFEIQVSDDGSREVMVDVEIMPRSERMLCRLGFGGDQIFRIPRVGQEVAVIIPTAKNPLTADEYDADGIIVAVMDANVPAELDGDDVVVITAPRVIVLSNSIQLGENAESLATKADVQAVRDDLHLHEHMYIPYPGGSAGAPVLTTTGPTVTAPTGTNIVTGD